jgi:hypothetical protein
MKCPATMCPIMAPDGSMWTGEKDAPCIQSACGFFDRKCFAASAAFEQVEDVKRNGSTLQLNPKGGKFAKRKPMAYDCPRANDCQWQKESQGLCPPRLALSVGVDPRACLF